MESFIRFGTTLFAILLLSCQSFTKKEVSELLSDNYFSAEFKPQHELAPITYDFFYDSMYLVTWQNDNDRRANIGYWTSTKRTFTTYDIGMPTVYKINRLTNNKLDVHNTKGSLSLKISGNSKTDPNFLIGDWIDYSDSIPSPPNLYNNGIKYINPQLSITSDTIYSRIPDIYFSKAPYNLLPSSHAIIIEHNRFYTHNPVFVIQNLTNDTLDIILQNTDGMTFKRKFTRNPTNNSM